MMVQLGWHWIFEAWEIEPVALDDKRRLAALLNDLPATLSLTVVSEARFVDVGTAPRSTTGAVLLGESHFCLQSFPDLGVLRGDLFSCKEFEVATARACVAEHFANGGYAENFLSRGALAGEMIGARTPPRPSVGPAWAYLAMEVKAKDDCLLAPERLQRVADRLADDLGVELADRCCHRFVPVGFSLLCRGQPGHLAIHTWPEQRRATVDVSLLLPTLEERRPALEDALASEGLEVVGAWLNQEAGC